MSKRCVIYCRVSSDRQREKSTIQSQKDILPKLARDQGFQIVETYIDDGISGETIEDRPAFKKLLQDADEKRFDAVFVIDYDRLSRSSDTIQLGLIKNILRENSIKVITPSQVYDFHDEEHDFMANLMGILAAREKRKIISRTQRGRLSKWNSGRHACGIVPFGYSFCRNTNVFRIETQEGKVVRLIFKLCLKGLGTEAITQELNLRGLPSFTDLRPQKRKKFQVGWARSSVIRILKSQTYCGSFKVNKTKRGSKGRLPREVSEVITIAVPPIVSRDDFDLAQKRLGERKTFAPRSKYDYLLSHLLKCGECGHALIGEFQYGRNKTGHPYYICYSRRKKKDGKTCELPWMRSDELEEVVWAKVESLLKTPEFLKKEIEIAYKESTEGRDEELNPDGLRAIIQEREKEKQRLIRAFAKEILSEDDLNIAVSKIDHEIRLLNHNLRSLEQRGSERAMLNAQLGEVERLLNGIRDRVSTLSRDKKRQVLRILTGAPTYKGIVVFKDKRVQLRGIIDFERVGELKQSVARVTTLLRTGT